ncbi:MAG: RNA polymerase sigma factor [Bacteroidales bacterium]|nr:RNA polymerase sigma factor [Bacteroidales bacterium]
MGKTGSKLTNIDDNGLINMALEGNGPESEAAFFTLYARYHKAVSGHIAKYVKESEEIEDICMESFEKAFGKLSTFKQENKLSTWLFRIARNTAFDHQEKARMRGQKIEKTSIDISPEETINVIDDRMSPEENVISTQDHENFLYCIDKLPEHYMSIAKMCFIDNLGYKEISEKAGIPVNTVKTRISRAKNLIVQMMLDMEE